jgi:protein-disulfide isomerase
MNSLTISLLLVSTLSAADLLTCPALTDIDKAKLAVYVQKKYKLDGMAGVKELPNVDDSCYRRFEFSSTFASNQKPFRAVLIASPDLRFLARELLDLRVDPVEEARKEGRALEQRLASPTAASLGSKSAPVTLVVFSDFQCPFCSRMASGLMQEIVPAEGDKVRVLFRHFPLPMHPWARAAAEATACAGTQNDKYFWTLHDYIFAHQRELTPANLVAKISEQGGTMEGFDQDRFKSCVEQRETAAQVDQDIAAGKELKVSGTPTLFINRQRVSGYIAEQIRTMIREQAPRPRNDN